MLRKAAFMALAVLTAGRAEAVPPIDSSALQFVERFCSAELRGHEKRYEVARWTTPSDDPERGVFLATWNEFVIVTECRVASVEVRNKRGAAIMVCRRVGRSPGGGLIVPEEVVSEKVPLKVRHDNGRWWVIDPPVARVHVDALIYAYEVELSRYSRDWESHATNVSKSGHQRIVDALDGLRRIRIAILGKEGRSGVEPCGE